MTKLLIGATLTLAAAPFALSQSVDWKSDYSSAVESAKESNQLIMLYFSTEWCGWCQRLKDDTFSDESVAERLNTSIVSIEVDAEKEGQELAEKYGVEGFPTIKMLDHEGNVWGTIVGYSPPEVFLATLDRVVRPFTGYAAAKQKVEDGSATADDFSLLALAYANRADMESAASYLSKAGEAGHGAHYFEAAIAVADAYRDNEDYDLAIPIYAKIAEGTESEADRAHAWVMTAICYLELEDRDKALEYANKVINMPADLPQHKDLANRIKQFVEGSDS